MKKIILLVLLVLVSCGVCYAENKDTKWEYVITKNNVAYSVDVNSPKFVADVILFWIAMDNENENKLGIIRVAVNPHSREYRFEEGNIFDKQTKKKTVHLNQR